MPRQKSTHVDDPVAVGKRLRAAREKAGLSQRQLAFPGCSPAYISRIESGDRIPSLQLLRELGRRLSVTEDWLATGSEDGRGEIGGAFLEAEVALRLDDLQLAETLYSEILEHAGADPSRARAEEGLGQVAYRRGNPREAIQRFEAALALYGTSERKHPDLADSLGRSYAMVGELESAIGVYEGCLEEAAAGADVLRQMQFMVLLGHALIDAGNFGRAEELLGQALALGKDSQSPSVRAHLYWTQSRLHAERNEPEPAARYARRALEVLRMTEDTYRTARAHQLLAHIELDRGRPDEALDVLEEGWPLLERNGNALERAQYRIEEARALAKIGRKEEAATLAMQISGIIADAHPEDAARSYAILAEVYEDLGDRARALELFELAAEILGDNNPNRYLASVYARMAELHEAEGRTDTAYELMKQAVGMQQAVAARLDA
ncbi:MAG TPA: tetratricopeptide repeat protein [Gaiellaceae bacterium]|nr:tetratricopeptide repeat protein [Gaiellaceae bacterium]